jgi:hypothetical protein
MEEIFRARFVTRETLPGGGREGGGGRKGRLKKQ